MARYCVGLLGATGETGTSILNGLLEDAGFDIVALARSSSLTKPANIALKDKGIELRALDLDGSEAAMVTALQGIDILISAVGPRDQLAQLSLVPAAKKAGVKRFVPCAFAPAMPVGVHQSRDQKEEVFNLTKRLHLPYTIIDVGWWYQLSLPHLPSGRTDYAIALPYGPIPGDGNVPSALTDLRDVGRYVTRVIKDDRTINAMVFVHNEIWTANQIYDLVEKLSKETITREYVGAEEFEKRIVEANSKLKERPEDFAVRAEKIGAQYSLSVGISEENTPEFAKYLGYLDGKELYPDIKFTTFEFYLQDVVSGKAKGVYDELKLLLKKAAKAES